MPLRLLVALPLMLLILLALPASPTLARPALPAGHSSLVTRPWAAGPILAGRNCGGTLLIAPGPPGAQEPIPAQIGAGWGVAGPVDPDADALRQVAPAMALDAAGQPIYIWQEASARDGGDIFVAGGGPTLGQTRRAVRVDDTGISAVEQRAPALAVAPGGAAFAVWQDRRRARGTSANPFFDLYFSRSSDGGQHWSANTLVSAPGRTQPSHRAPVLLADSAGTMHLLYVADGTTRDDIRHTSYSGGAWAAPTPVNDSPAASRGQPALALAGDGDLLAAWEDSRDGTVRIYVDRLDLSGGAAVWGADVAATPIGEGVVRPSLAVGADGTLYLAYEVGLNSGGGIFLVSSADGGQSWGQPQPIGQNTGNATNPQLAVDSAGGLHCIWCQLMNGSANILASRSTNDGQGWLAAATLASTTGTAEPLALAADKQGHVFAAWADGADNTPILYAATWSAPPGDRRLYLPALVR